MTMFTAEGLILSAVRREYTEECLLAVERAVELSQRINLSPEKIESLGDGWVAEEALAIGICCALFAGNDFRKGVLFSVNHSGDSDASGSITGSIIGSLYGKESIPKPWLSNLEMREVVEEIASDVADPFPNRS